MKLGLILPFFFLANLISAQKQTTTQQQIWYVYYLKIPIGTHWQIREELDDRSFINPSRQFQFLSRTHIERNLGKGWDVALGFAYFDQALPPDPNVKDYTNYGELRPSFEVAYLNQLSDKWSLRQRLWYEFRYFQQDDHSYLYGNMRARYKIEGQYILSPFLRLLATDEIFINIGENIVHNTFDQNRFSIGFQVSPIKNVAFEVSYINWYQQRPSGYEYYNRNIIKFALHHTLPILKKKTESKS